MMSDFSTIGIAQFKRKLSSQTCRESYTDLLLRVSSQPCPGVNDWTWVNKKIFVLWSDLDTWGRRPKNEAILFVLNQESLKKREKKKR